MESAETRETHEMSHEGPVFYLDNALVPLGDGCRVLGPYDRGKMKQKRQVYERLIDRITHGMGETEREEFMRSYSLGVYQVEVDSSLRIKISITPLEM
ncbi:MAG: hypothetical protein HYW27_02225 [Candidatus Aenigmarchaeota archaeon]|nr:hypothetical protein [Candidatus Aenigmarchaeota archaeon]